MTLTQRWKPFCHKFIQNEKGNMNMVAFATETSSKSADICLKAITEDEDCILSPGDINKKLMILYNPKNFGRTCSC